MKKAFFLIGFLMINMRMDGCIKAEDLNVNEPVGGHQTCNLATKSCTASPPQNIFATPSTSASSSPNR